MCLVARWVCAVAVAWACAFPASAAPTGAIVRTVGEVSPLGWPYSGFAEGTVDSTGGLVFVAKSTAVFQRQGAALAQRLGAGLVLPDGRRVAGVGAPALATDGCVLARCTFQAGGEAIVRACGARLEIVLDAGAAAPGGGTIQAFDPAVAVAGTQTIGMGATLTDGTAVLMRRDADGVVEIARAGAPTPSGGTFSSFRLLGVASAGDVGFRATMSGGRDGIFLGTGQDAARRRGRRAGKPERGELRVGRGRHGPSERAARVPGVGGRRSGGDLRDRRRGAGASDGRESGRSAAHRRGCHHRPFPGFQRSVHQRRGHGRVSRADRQRCSSVGCVHGRAERCHFHHLSRARYAARPRDRQPVA